VTGELRKLHNESLMSCTSHPTFFWWYKWQ